MINVETSFFVLTHFENRSIVRPRAPMRSSHWCAREKRRENSSLSHWLSISIGSIRQSLHWVEFRLRERERETLYIDGDNDDDDNFLLLFSSCVCVCVCDSLSIMIIIFMNLIK